MEKPVNSQDSDIFIHQNYAVNALGTPSEVVEIFGGKENYRTAVSELKAQIYSAA